jgi:hypothetical protein
MTEHLCVRMQDHKGIDCGFQRVPLKVGKVLLGATVLGSTANKADRERTVVVPSGVSAGDIVRATSFDTAISTDDEVIADIKPPPLPVPSAYLLHAYVLAFLCC